MTPQEMFNTVATHLFAQGEQAMRDDTRPGCDGEICAYRGENGTKCAMGALIPDGLYISDMENKEIRTVIGEYPVLKTIIQDDRLASALQTVHDEEDYWHSTSAMREALIDVAMDRDLYYSIINTLSFKDK